MHGGEGVGVQSRRSHRRAEGEVLLYTDYDYLPSSLPSSIPSLLPPPQPPPLPPPLLPSRLPTTLTLALPYQKPARSNVCPSLFLSQTHSVLPASSSSPPHRVLISASITRPHLPQVLARTPVAHQHPSNPHRHAFPITCLSICIARTPKHNANLRAEYFR